MNAAELHAESFIWDDHCGFEMNPDLPLEQMIRPWREAGVDYLSLNVYYDPQPWTAAIENIASVRRRLPGEVPYCRLVSTTAEVDQAKAEGMMAVTFDIEGMNSLNGRVDLIQTYYELGVRHMLFAYNKNNLAGSGCHDEDTGLTDFGREVIAEMNRVGMVIDCTHTGYRTTMEAMEHSCAPVVFSHSNPSALVRHGRNISDEQIKACAATGGVIGINGVNLFLGEAEATPKGVARHAAYVAELTAPEHVGLTLDYAPSVDGGESIAEMILQDTSYWPPDAGYDASVSCLDIRQLPAVADELAAIGFNDSELANILGGNFRRIADAVWK